jgi:hypothetical protein
MVVKMDRVPSALSISSIIRASCGAPASALVMTCQKPRPLRRKFGQTRS